MKTIIENIRLTTVYHWGHDILRDHIQSSNVRGIFSSPCNIFNDNLTA